MRTTRISLPLALLLILLLSGMSVYAMEGTLTYFAGTVTVQRGDRTLQGEIGMIILEGDVIATGHATTAIVSLAGDADIKLRSDTTLDMASLDDDVKVRLRSGSIFSKVRRKLLKSYTLQADTVLAGVRGTEFFVAYGRTVDARPDIWLCVNEGSVEVAVPESGQRTVVKEGEGINVLAGVKLTKPKEYAWTRDLNWNSDPRTGEVQDNTNLDQAYSDLLDQDYD
jgi:ferric-dicitrate binding protein FerR (iron transport regulator)